MEIRELGSFQRAEAWLGNVLPAAGTLSTTRGLCGGQEAERGPGTDGPVREDGLWCPTGPSVSQRTEGARTGTVSGEDLQAAVLSHVSPEPCSLGAHWAFRQGAICGR